MAFATPQERLDLIAASPAFGLEYVVLIRGQGGRESELPADDFEHAIDLASNWKNVHKAAYVEMFRVNQQTGELYGGIGEF